MYDDDDDDDDDTIARGYAYAKIEYVSVRTYLSKNRIRVRHVSYTNLNSPIDISQKNVWKHVKVLRSGKRTPWFNATMGYCDKQFWKLFTLSAAVLIKLLCCSCNVLFTYAKIEYVSVSFKQEVKVI